MLQNILTVVTTIGAIITPLLLLWLGNRYKDLQESEQNLREERIELYYKILEPYMLLWESDEVVLKGAKKGKKGADAALEIFFTREYQKLGFELTLIGTDDVVKAYNNLMQTFYNMGNLEEKPEKEKEQYTIELFSYIGRLFLAIRRSLGNKKTNLHPLEILEWKIKDMRNYKLGNKYPNV